MHHLFKRSAWRQAYSYINSRHGPSCGITKRTLKMSWQSLISFKLNAEVTGHKQITFPKSAFLFWKPAKCVSYFSLHVPSCCYWNSTLLTPNTQFIHRAKSLLLTVLHVMHNSECSWCSVHSNRYTQHVRRCALASSVNSNVNHFTICRFYFTECAIFYHSPLFTPTTREICKDSMFTFVRGMRVLFGISHTNGNRSAYETSKPSKRCHVMLCLL
jgi:ribosomal protein S14